MITYKNLKYLAVLVLFLIVCFIGFELSTQRSVSIDAVLTPLGAQGNLPIPQAEFEPILDSARQEMNQRFDQAQTLKLWERILNWSALAITSIVTIVAGFFGRRFDPESIETMTAKDVVGRSNQSQLNIRLIGILLALSTVCGIFGQQFKSESVELTNQANLINQSIIETVEVLYDLDSTEQKARIALEKLIRATRVQQ